MGGDGEFLLLGLGCRETEYRHLVWNPHRPAKLRHENKELKSRHGRNIQPVSFMQRTKNMCKFFHPGLQFLSNFFLPFSETRRHNQEVLLHAVDKWNGEPVVNYILLCDDDKPREQASRLTWITKFHLHFQGVHVIFCLGLFLPKKVSAIYLFISLFFFSQSHNMKTKLYKMC